jgi:hypothetical protein
LRIIFKKFTVQCMQEIKTICHGCSVLIEWIKLYNPLINKSPCLIKQEFPAVFFRDLRILGVLDCKSNTLHKQNWDVFELFRKDVLPNKQLFSVSLISFTLLQSLKIIYICFGL